MQQIQKGSPAHWGSALVIDRSHWISGGGDSKTRTGSWISPHSWLDLREVVGRNLRARGQLSILVIRWKKGEHIMFHSVPEHFGALSELLNALRLALNQGTKTPIWPIRLPRGHFFPLLAVQSETWVTLVIMGGFGKLTPRDAGLWNK